MQMTRLASLVVAGWLALGGAVQAAETVVVELFTSQGCSSCPPADRILGELADDDDIIALAFHVDYWDYLGWKDEFGSPANTKRQKAYAHAMGERSVYTPQMVIGGQEHVVGSRGMKVAKAIQRHARQAMPVSVRLQRQGNSVAIRAFGSGSLPNMVVQVATYTPKATVDVRRGENAGRTLTYHNVVRSFSTVGRWDGQGTFNATAPLPNDLPVVVLVQARNGGAILGAARVK